MLHLPSACQQDNGVPSVMTAEKWGVLLMEESWRAGGSRAFGPCLSSLPCPLSPESWARDITSGLYCLHDKQSLVRGWFYEKEDTEEHTDLSQLVIHGQKMEVASWAWCHTHVTPDAGGSQAQGLL